MVKTRRRGYGILLLTTLVLIGVMLVALSLGRYQLSFSELIATLTGQTSVSPVIHNIVFSLRLPRILPRPQLVPLSPSRGLPIRVFFKIP